ncbi:o-succinylbenzoate synthase [Shewanella cyperi]|uniref:o-succinylbenzoate synthase n=1 Tax=Shewanella cyperi TaxID=2814292 RepID=UPI001D18FC99|nr:o-succinylbenzoate synthase [Shewanella cyperi]
MTEITRLALYGYQIPLNPPLPVGRQRITSRHGLLLRAFTDQDEAVVELAPLSGTDMDGEPIEGFSRESLRQLQEELIALLPQLGSTEALERAAGQTALPSLAWGLGLLALKLEGQLTSRQPRLAPVPLIYRLPNETADELVQRLAKLPRDCRFAKLKIAQNDVETELRLIYALLAARPDIRLRLDANGGFTLTQAADFCACLPRISIDFIEDPCRESADCEALHSALGLGYALDAPLNAPDFELSPLAGLRALVLKPMLIGSPAKVQALIAAAQQLGMRCIISSTLESSLGISDLAAFAAQETPDEAPGLDTLAAFEADLLVSSGKALRLEFGQLPLLASWEAGC